MSDVILTNKHLLGVLTHFHIEIGFSEDSVEVVCRNYRVDPDFFLFVCNIYNFENYWPSRNLVRGFDPSEVINYLRSVHKEYATIMVPGIIKTINSMSNCFASGKDDTLSRFCEQYNRDIHSHFKYEEEVVFPFIEQYIKTGSVEGFDVELYENNHSDIESSINDLKSIIIKYLPRECVLGQWKEVLCSLFDFETSIDKHTRIEELIIASICDEQ